MKKVLKIMKWILFGILAMITIIIGIVFTKSKVNPDKVPDLFGYKPFIVLSGSMETQIYVGDLVIVKEIEPDTLKVNDIIAFKDTDGYVVTHRIVEVVEDGFITKGDNNNTEDVGVVSKQSIEGIYVTKLDGMGNVVLFMQKTETLVITILIIIVLGTLWLTFDNKKISNDERKELEELRKKVSKN